MVAKDGAPMDPISAHLPQQLGETAPVARYSLSQRAASRAK